MILSFFVKNKMVEWFLEFITYNLCYSDRTVNSYQYTLHRFWDYIAKFWHNIDKPNSITYDDINKRIISQKNLSSKTINTRLSALKTYFNWCNDKDIKCLDPKKIKSLKEYDKEIGYFSDVQKKQILHLVDQWFWNSEELQIRTKLLVYILMFTGLRIQEALNIKTKDINESLQIIGKGNIHRWTFLRPEILDLAKEYLNKKKHYSDYLFSTVWNSKTSKVWYQLKQMTTQNIFIQMSKKLWFHVHAHKFRHTYATWLLKLKWSNIYNIARLLWHKNISTTQIYLWYNNSELKKLQFSLKI